MEDSLSSYSNGNKQDDDMVEEEEEEEEEESGWTTYFDDFFDSQTTRPKDHDQHQPSPEFLDDDQSCIVSDAASYVEYWKKSNNNMMISNALFGASPKFSKKLKFKKTRTNEISYDDSLEDTASSPVNSPKVGSLKEMEYFNQRKADHDCVESPMRQVRGFDQQLQLQLQTADGSRNHQMGFQGDRININDDRSNLRKKGMCLVPVSMFANYLG